jgi:hypothetical protein
MKEIKTKGVVPLYDRTELNRMGEKVESLLCSDAHDGDWGFSEVLK